MLVSSLHIDLNGIVSMLWL